jgi:hypothetical protein
LKQTRNGFRAIASITAANEKTNQQSPFTDVRFGSKADIALGPLYVRFASNSGH